MKFFKLRPEIKVVLIPNFLIFFLNFGPNIGAIYVIFTIFPFSTVSIFSYSFAEEILFIYSLVTFSNPVI